MSWRTFDEQTQKNTSVHFNMILIGKTGDGKSASGNTILGQKVFISKRGHKTVTKEVQKERVIVDGVTLDVYDTPGLDPDRNNEDIMEKCQPLLRLDWSAPTVFLLVMRADRFTQEEKKTVELIEAFIPERLLQNSWILFTGGDELENEDLSVEEVLEDTEELKRVVQRFTNRYHVFNNRINNPEQVRRLIEKIKKGPLSMAPEFRIPQTTSPPPVKDPVQRIVLLGRSGVGKSAAGNTILREKKRFRSKSRQFPVTEQSEMQQAVVAGRRVCVVDTPGLFNTHISPENLAVEMSRSVYLSSPGPHAFLYVLPINRRFTQQEEQIIPLLEQMFGEEMRNYTIVLFTHGDQLKGKGVNVVIKKHEYLSRLVDQCGGRYHVFNNKDLKNRQQVTELLEKIDRMVEKNGGSCYSNQMFEEAVRYRQEEEEKVMREEEQRRKDRERVKNEMGEITKEKISREKVERAGHEKSNECSIS